MTNLPSQANGSTHLSQERADHREWIGGRALTLLSHYWREDDPAKLTAAIGQDWADVLEGLPQEYIKRACLRYQREQPRKKPTPGDIYQLTMKIMPRQAPKPKAEEERIPCSQEAATEILRKAGFTPKRAQAVKSARTATTPEQAEQIARDRATPRPHWSDSADPDGPEVKALKQARHDNRLVKDAQEQQRGCAK